MNKTEKALLHDVQNQVAGQGIALDLEQAEKVLGVLEMFRYFQLPEAEKILEAISILKNAIGDND